MVYFFGILVLLTLWMHWRVDVKGSVMAWMTIHIILGVCSMGFAAGALIAWLADHHQL